MAVLKTGLSGEPVRRLQAKLGVEADGAFGPNTEKARLFPAADHHQLVAE